ncbi:MAG: hypothetical protein ACRDQU_17545 [Pseudonocardiaceae bacterium]
MDTLEQWYLRSYTDGDTHYGKTAVDGMMTARCGLTFAPLQQLFSDGPVVVLAPVNPWRACPLVPGRR